MRKRTSKSLVAGLVLVSLLAGCVGLPPVYSPRSLSASYVVKKGDTLYSIAFKYGLDYKSLARINGIRPPYIIYADQRIRLKGSARHTGKDSGPTVAKSPSRPTSRSSAKVSKPPVNTSSLPDQVASWRWPLNGKVIGRFSLSNPVNKGIDIAGKNGEKVVAAADGVVVYAGGNLRGYGKLVIIKHSDNFLSAYGNNKSMLVKEGEKVKAGKSIARVGSSASNTEMLHFEIRRDGKPEDPLKYLPGKNNTWQEDG